MQTAESKAICPLVLCVGMHASEEIVDTEVSHENGEECECHEEMICERFSERRNAVVVNSYGIYHESD